MNRSLIDTIENQCTAYYQPIVELETGRVVGFEALTRIRGDDGAMSSPGAFIDEIENDVDTLTVLMRQILCAVSNDMVSLFARYPDFYVSINIPPVVLGTGLIMDIMQELQLMPYIKRLVVEVTERQALTALGRAALERVTANGIRVADRKSVV